MAANDLVEHLRRQHLWYREWWRWLLAQRVLPTLPPRPRALDVGCGPGYVMDDLADLLDVRGVDIDGDMVASCQARGLEVQEGDAHHLPFEDGAFDLVYCSFTLVWTRDPARALREMARVSRRWVACLAEPDYEASIWHPAELEGLGALIVRGVREAGGDPAMGRRLRPLLSAEGMSAEAGVNPGIWDLERERRERDQEMRWARSLLPRGAGRRGEHLLSSWAMALDQGTLLRFHPVFHAMAEVPQTEERASRQR